MNKNAREKELLEEAYASLYEAKEAPKGKHYDSAGRLRSGDADADGRGGPKYRSDPTYDNPNDPSDEEDYVRLTKGSTYNVHNVNVRKQDKKMMDHYIGKGFKVVKKQNEEDNESMSNLEALISSASEDGEIDIKQDGGTSAAAFDAEEKTGLG
jgi:hypothetical protein